MDECMYAQCMHDVCGTHVRNEANVHKFKLRSYLMQRCMCQWTVSTQCQVGCPSPPGQEFLRTLSCFPSPCTPGHHTPVLPPSDYGCGGGHGTCCRNERCPESQQHTSTCACIHTQYSMSGTCHIHRVHTIVRKGSQVLTVSSSSVADR